MISNLDKARKDIKDLKPIKALKHARDAFEDAIDALQYTTYRGYGGQSALLPEVQEAFKEISIEALKLKGSFNNFGDDSKKDYSRAASALNDAGKNIANAIGEYSRSFQAIFQNIAKNLKGM